MDMLARNRKFKLAVGFYLVSSAALFTGHISGGEYVMGMGVILGLYGAANVVGKKDV